jgi:hypothetical protein
MSNNSCEGVVVTEMKKIQPFLYAHVQITARPLNNLEAESGLHIQYEKLAVVPIAYVP